jgi:hypothetical protein
MLENYAEEVKGLGVGSHLWLFDNNVSVYDENKKYLGRGKWRKYSIILATSRSWVLEGETRVDKISLTINRGKYGREQAYTEKMMHDRIWVSEKRLRLLDLLQRCNDIEKLKMVATILGFN